MFAVPARIVTVRLDNPDDTPFVPGFLDCEIGQLSTITQDGKERVTRLQSYEIVEDGKAAIIQLAIVDGDQARISN